MAGLPACGLTSSGTAHIVGYLQTSIAATGSAAVRVEQLGLVRLRARRVHARRVRPRPGLVGRRGYQRQHCACCSSAVARATTTASRMTLELRFIERVCLPVARACHATTLQFHVPPTCCWGGGGGRQPRGRFAGTRGERARRALPAPNPRLAAARLWAYLMAVTTIRCQLS